MGTVALGAGAIDDATTWCLLAFVLASFDREPAQAVSVIGMGVEKNSIYDCRLLIFEC